MKMHQFIRYFMRIAPVALCALLFANDTHAQLSPPAPDSCNTYYSFDGVGTANAAHDASFNLANHFTIECWFRSADPNQTQRYIANKNNRYALLYGYVNNTVEFFCAAQTGDNPRPHSYLPLPDQNWHHIAYTYDSTRFKSYLDGVLVTDTALTFTLASIGSAFTIGGPTTLRLVWRAT